MSPIKTFNQSFSCLYPMILPVDLDFTNSQEYVADFSQIINQGAIDFISSVYVDLFGQAFDLDLYSNVCNQVIRCRAGTITTMPIFLGNAPKIKAKVSMNIASSFEIIVTNIPLYPFVQFP